MEETSADVQMLTKAEKNLNALLLTERRGRTGSTLQIDAHWPLSVEDSDS